MSKYTYKTILSKAQECQTSVKKEYKTTITWRWSYYFAKQILNPKKDVTKITFKDAPNPTGTSISRGVPKADYIDICKRLVKFVESKKVMPNYVSYKSYKINPRLLCEFLSRILVSYNKNGKLPSTISITSKVFNKPVETGNKVYDYACNKYGKKFKTMDEVLEYVAKHFTYQFYYDDHKSNKQVTDSKSGNCTDLLQWFINMCEAMGYEWKCLHVMCSSGVGHVRGQFRHKKYTENTWVYRDIAAVANGDGIRANWCSSGYSLLAVNPSWFMQNLRR